MIRHPVADTQTGMQKTRKTTFLQTKGVANEDLLQQKQSPTSLKRVIDLRTVGMHRQNEK